MKLIAFAFALLMPVLASGQAYPSKPVKILVPAQPGGGLDLVGRTMAEQLGRAFKQSFVVENSGGGGGSIASMTVARAAPDGYTLMVGYVGTHGTNPATRKVNYDAVKDFTPIGMVGGTPNLLIVQPAMPVRDLKGLVERAKAEPGKLTYGSGGIGTLNHLIWEQFRGAAGFEAVTVHYRGIGPAFTDFLGGQVETMTPGLAAAMPHLRTKKAKPLAITGTKRHPLVPDVPTFEELGYKDFDGVQWYGIVGPAKMPDSTTRRLNEEINKAIASPSLRERLSSEAIDPMPMTPAEFGRFIQAEIARWTRLARERGISLEE
jgi:tripartite-type tricarboxylate transporter receptor subunit TctC